MKNIKGITLISLVVTIVILIILSVVVINLSIGENGILKSTKETSEETTKQVATEKMNLKITNVQMNTYAEKQEMPTLQELADSLCEDDEIQYVELESKKKIASLDKIIVGESNSIYTKLKDYEYEFEINSSMQLASIDGVKIATGETETEVQFTDIAEGWSINGKAVEKDGIVFLDISIIGPFVAGWTNNIAKISLPPLRDEHFLTCNLNWGYNKGELYIDTNGNISVYNTVAYDGSFLNCNSFYFIK